tara:strand:- start:79 stop:360 length:282 start_codon:yes stop_codon:yes gene_type:complete
MAKKVRLYEYKEINSRGAILHLARYQGDENWKFHRWDGPAIDPYDKSSEMIKAFYLNGIEYDEEIYSEIMQEREGLPWYKNSSMKNLLSDYRN